MPQSSFAGTQWATHLTDQKPNWIKSDLSVDLEWESTVINYPKQLTPTHVLRWLDVAKVLVAYTERQYRNKREFTRRINDQPSIHDDAGRVYARTARLLARCLRESFNWLETVPDMPDGPISPFKAQSYLTTVAQWIKRNEACGKTAPAVVLAPATEPNKREGKASSTTAKKRRGRPPDTDHRQDMRIAEAWASKQYKTFDELDREMKLTPGTAKRANERHRKRLANRRKKSR